MRSDDRIFMMTVVCNCMVAHPGCNCAICGSQPQSYAVVVSEGE